MQDLSELTDEELIQLLTEIPDKEVLRQWWIDCYGSPHNPDFLADGITAYPDWQRRFYDAGAWAKQRMIIAANGVGKSQSVCAELAAHVTGEYPDWWSGVRYERGGWEAWIGSIDNDMQKRGPQRALIGRDLSEMIGTGLIPARCIVDFDRRQAGVKDVVDTVVCKHASGEKVIIKWLTYEQGWRKWQSGDPRIVLMDEEPDESDVRQTPILSEILTRLVRNSGILLVGYTPLLGDTALTTHFKDSDDPGVYYVTAGWDDAPHMSDADKKMIKSQYKDHEVDARTKGIPMMGEGRIFTTTENMWTIDPIKVPDYWARIKGIDFGLAHPASTVELAHDRDNDIIYLIDDWCMPNQKTADHANQINSKNDWIPVAWPHDGEKRDPRSGTKFADIYRNNHHVKMLGRSARYKNDEGGAQAQWPIIEMVQDRMKNGKFKVFRTCRNFIKEAQSYHTKDGVIVARRDDTLKAALYGVMMIRYAVSKSEALRVYDEMSGPAAFTTAVG